MAISPAITSILLVSNNPSVHETTRTTLAQEENLKLLDMEVTSENLFKVITETKPDLILLDFDFQSQPFTLVDKIITGYPKSAVVAILSQEEMVNLDRVVLSGARAFIQYPYPPDKLVITIKRVLELLDRNQPEASEALMEEDTRVILGKTYTVFSPKGGAGTTTLAVNLAISLHDTTKKEVLLVDGKHLFGHVALYLNLLTGNSITDLIAHAGMLDEKLIRQVVVHHNSGIHVLPSPNAVVEAQGIRPESLFKVVQGLQQVFPYIIVDGGNGLNENLVTYMDSSEKILLVVNPNLASLKDVKQFLDVSTTLSYPKDKMLLVLNLTGRRADVRKEKIEEILKLKVISEVPADEDLALSCLNEGVPILVKKPRHRISRAISDISKELVKIKQPEKSKKGKK